MAKRGRPSVAIVLTDDQGYGDLGCTGNPWLRTPHLDRFHAEAVRCSDFHVAPLCTPTRGALMTGRRPVRNGAWATCWGRSILRRDEITLADLFSRAGYRTGLFGKWHLGDNPPYRPQDRGFQTVVAHKGGGVGQSPDYWGNAYFDDTYFHNGRPVRHAGYCTDVWFEEALRFIGDDDPRPFLAVVSTNAPHTPWLVPDAYRAPYEGRPEIPHPAFYGMIASIDENFGRLRARLREQGREDDTILVFLTDNGSSGCGRHDPRGFLLSGYNAGMRGVKGSYYDGGHRVPFFVRWPRGGLAGGRDVTEMALGIDLLPTLADLCGLPLPAGVVPDGRSFAPLLRGECAAFADDRFEFLQFRQSTAPPEKWDSAVLTRRWRLVRGEELYDIAADPGQREDVAARHPDVVARLRDAHEAWWAEIAPGLEEPCPISLGTDAENPTTLCAMDVLGDVAWSQPHIAEARRTTGCWAVRFERPGRYRFALRRWPEELGLALDAALAAEDAARLCAQTPVRPPVALHPVRARLGFAGREWRAAVRPGDVAAVFETDVARAETTRLEAWFADAAGAESGAYYVAVERLGA